MKFNKVFQQANNTRCRYKVLLGSAGSGKSVNVAQDYIVKLSDMRFRGANLLVVRSAENTHLNSTFAELTKAVYEAGLSSIWTIKVNPLSLRCTVTGNEIIFRGCNDQKSIERLKSVTVQQGNLCWIWLEEATELLQQDFEILDDRLRGTLPNHLYYQITLSFNPINVNHWIKKTLWDSLSENVFKCKSTFLDNAFIDEEFSKRMERRKEVDPEGYEVYGLGNWGEISGLVFSNWQVGEYREIPLDSFSVGIDWGYNHNTAITTIGFYDEDIYVLDEIVMSGKTTQELIDACLENKTQKLDCVMYCDSAEPDRIREFKNAGFRAVAVEKESGSVRAQIGWLQNRRIFIDKSCVQMIKEIQAYKYKKDQKTGIYFDEPVGVFDDSIASLRYAIEPYRKAKRLVSIPKGLL